MVESASNLSDCDDTLTVSAALVGGVDEEEFAFDEASAVSWLIIESADGARVVSGRDDAIRDAMLKKRSI